MHTIASSACLVLLCIRSKPIYIYYITAFSGCEPSQLSKQDCEHDQLDLIDARLLHPCIIVVESSVLRAETDEHHIMTACTYGEVTKLQVRALWFA